MKAVLDTNVWLDWLVFDDPSSHELRRVAEAGAIVLPASAATRAEWLDVIRRPLFGLDETARAAVAERYDRHALILADAAGVGDGAPARLVCSDPDDQKFLELALACGARFLVTRDKALLRLARQALRRHGLAIVQPEAPAWREALAGQRGIL